MLNSGFDSTAFIYGKELYDIDMAFKVSVDRKKCNGCEECLEACTVGMFRMINGKASPLANGECIGCESCMGVCDENAITVTDTRVALSDTCQSLLAALDEEETGYETENRRADGR
jgi:NAD-dependent dihydropyrimidine dehydrogenase PreA subunit